MSALNTSRTKPVRMTRMHFQVIAKALRDYQPAPGEDPNGVFDTIVQGFADALAETNDRFDRKTFIEACR